MAKWLGLGLLILFLAGCATVTPAPIANSPVESWQTRQTQLAKINHWTLKGAVSFQQNNQRDSAHLTWNQLSQSRYAIDFIAPLGMGSAKLHSNKSGVTLTSGKQKFHANSARQLLNKTFGWDLPVKNLYYWVRGIPAPGGVNNKKFDAKHRLSQLTQSGWTVIYQRYTTVKHTDLPSKIKIIRGKIIIQLVVSAWQKVS